MTGDRGPNQTHDVSPYVEFSLFQLSDTLEVGAPLAFQAPGARLFTAGSGGVLFGSAGNDFYPHVHLQLWAQEPPAAHGNWDLIEESSFDTRTGRLQFMSVNAVPAGEEIVLPAAGTYGMRAHCRGRGEASARLGQREHLHYRGVEEWLIQLWPDTQ